MKKEFYIGNRKTLYKSLKKGAIVLGFAGKQLRKTADAMYPFFADRNFVYLTGLEKAEYIFMAEINEVVTETIFILPKNLLAERWNGRRLSPEEVKEISGIENVKYLEEFEGYFHKATMSGCYKYLAIDLYKCDVNDINKESHNFAEFVVENYPQFTIVDTLPQLKKQRTIKQDCEIDAIKKAVVITRDGILAMMKASKPGLYEYQLKAEFDRALAWHGVLEPAFQSIISAGENNFCIHYDEYSGIINEGDMVLNDVGAHYDHLVNDVSRGWPCNGKFSEKQRLLYICAFNTSQYMFSIIKPGMPMADVDRLAREYNFKQLQALGLCDNYEEVGKLIWHGGAHHIGFDVHDVVDMTMPVSAGMVFCVDVGIYCEEWGIGFRLEDNCLVTENGCLNLTASIPRSIEEIEEAMKK